MFFLDKFCLLIFFYFLKYGKKFKKFFFFFNFFSKSLIVSSPKIYLSVGNSKKKLLINSDFKVELKKYTRKEKLENYIIKKILRVLLKLQQKRNIFSITTLKKKINTLSIKKLKKKVVSRLYKKKPRLMKKLIKNQGYMYWKPTFLFSSFKKKFKKNTNNVTRFIKEFFKYFMFFLYIFNNSNNLNFESQGKYIKKKKIILIKKFYMRGGKKKNTSNFFLKELFFKKRIFAKNDTKLDYIKELDNFFFLIGEKKKLNKFKFFFLRKSKPINIKYIINNFEVIPSFFFFLIKYLEFFTKSKISLNFFNINKFAFSKKKNPILGWLIFKFRYFLNKKFFYLFLKMMLLTFFCKDITFLKNYFILFFSREKVLKQMNFILFFSKVLNFFYYFFRKYFKICGIFFKLKGKLNVLGSSRKRIHRFSRGKYSTSNMFLQSSLSSFFFLNPPGTISFFMGLYF